MLSELCWIKSEKTCQTARCQACWIYQKAQGIEETTTLTSWDYLPNPLYRANNLEKKIVNLLEEYKGDTQDTINPYKVAEEIILLIQKEGGK